MKNRSKRKTIANETMNIINNGFYINSEKNKISINEELKNSIKNTKLYTPESFIEVYNERDNILKNKKQNNTIFELNNETTLSSANKLINIEQYKKVVCLNFASAKNPGGGFLNGSQAQEESLSRASGLYACISKKEEMYNTNRKCGTCLYTDNIILSPNVPVFRNDNDDLLDKAYKLSIITSPAVNKGAIVKNEPNNINRIEEVMLKRIEKILSICVIHNYSIIILGAWGCGVFKNDPKDVSTYFYKVLMENKFKNIFDKIVFAVLDKSTNKSTFNAFKSVFIELL